MPPRVTDTSLPEGLDLYDTPCNTQVVRRLPACETFYYVKGSMKTVQCPDGTFDFIMVHYQSPMLPYTVHWAKAQVHGEGGVAYVSDKPCPGV